jgi:hypothetical protein
MLIDRETFARLCLARSLLCDVHEASPSVAALAAHLGVSRLSRLVSWTMVDSRRL